MKGSINSENTLIDSGITATKTDTYRNSLPWSSVELPFAVPQRVNGKLVSGNVGQSTTKKVHYHMKDAYLKRSN